METLYRLHLDGQGDWDGYGCREYNSSSDNTTCLCNHLTHFGVLLVHPLFGTVFFNGKVGLQPKDGVSDGLPPAGGAQTPSE